MKFICTDDWHLRNSTPKHRVDDFTQTQLEKVAWIFALSIQHRAPILNAGDIFNSAKEPYGLLFDYIEDSINSNINICCITGQHDMKYHNTKEFKDTPLGNLYINKHIRLAGAEPIRLANVDIYGCGWGEEIPAIQDDITGFNILLIHRMIAKKKLWPGHEFQHPDDLLTGTEFDLIVSGDNHKTFTSKYKGRMLINAGCIVRQKSDEMNRKPCVYLYDTDTRKAERIYIPIKPADEVFDLEGIEKAKERKEKLKMGELIDAISVKGSKAPNFLKILNKVIKEADPHKRTKQYVDEFIKEAQA